MKIIRSGVTATLLFGVLYALAPSGATQSSSQTQPNQANPPTATATTNEAQQLPPEEQRKRKSWSDLMMRRPAPKKGCFTGDYPNMEWREVPCVKPPNIPGIPRNSPRPAVVGNNNDISAGAPSGHITEAIGHFENVTDVTSESGPIANAGAPVNNAYTLQINSDFFTDATACSGSPNPACKAWEQWIFWNSGSGNGSVSMQYWLIAYNTTCPAGQNWNQIALYGGTYCWKNSANATSVPNQPITSMANWTFSGTANSGGDEVALSAGGLPYKATGDNAVSAATGWNTAEFNLFGYGGNSSGGGTASFNSGAAANTRTEIIYGGTAAPNCVAQGFTAEMNNLSFGPTAPAASAPGPAILFAESTAGGATSNCAAASTIGDTHLRTFKGLFYDFQASGDFTLAEVGSDFAVQTRQVSGAPTWPNATVNKAVAARFGTTSVALCLAAPGRQGGGAGVFVDGKPTAVDNGQNLGLPGNVGIFRQGNVYQITSENGDSVQATMNPTWINVAVGLGRTPSAARGLISNPGDNVNQIATRDGAVLTNPFSFNDLYHRFADSWRVPPENSLLSVCGPSTEIGAPQRPFFVADLEPGVRTRAEGVCTAAGVKPGALLDACTLDVAVIGSDDAAKVYVNAIPPTAVGTVEGGGGVFTRWWWLWLLLLILLILLILLLRRKKP